MKKSNSEKEIAGFLIMLGSAFINHKPTQAKMFSDGLLMTLGKDTKDLKKFAETIKNQNNKNDNDTIDIEYQEVKE